MNDSALNLLDAITAAFDRWQHPTPVPGGPDQTHCNQAVGKVLMTLGSHELRNIDGTPLNADQMVEDMDAESKSGVAWTEINMEDAQGLANAGQIVVAGMSSADLGQSHGHVVVCRPGNADQSAKWSGLCPKVSHVGENSLIGIGAEWAFPGTKRPRFFQLKQEA